MMIRRREAKSGTRWDVEWLLPDGTKRSKTFKTVRAAKLFDGEVRSARQDGQTVDPRRGKTELNVLYKSWLASRPDLSPKVRRGCEDNWRLRRAEVRQLADRADLARKRPGMGQRNHRRRR